MTDVQDFMTRSKLFSNLSPSTMERISNRMERVRFAANDVICREGDPGGSMFIVASGEVTICKDMGWGQRELDRMRPGDAFGEMALISNERRTATARALVETECLRLNEEDFDTLLAEDARFAQRVAQVLSKRLAALGQDSSQDLLGAYRALIFALADLAEFRDPETGAHLERTRDYCTLLGDLLSSHPSFEDEIRPAFVDGIHYVTPLHDIGKVAIPDSILLKPGKLTSEEFEIMKGHTTFGAEALNRVLDQSDQEVFQMAHCICLYHHERWDGKGYPLGLSGSEIPLAARIMSIADVFDALLSKRVYKPAISYQETLALMSEASGSQFDPEMIATFVENGDRFEAIYRSYSG